MRKKNYKSIILALGFSLFLCLNSLYITGYVLAQTLSREEKNNLTQKGYRNHTLYTLPERPALVDYEKVLLTRNPVIQSAYAEWQTEVKKIALVRGLPDPQINFGYFIQNIETAVGPQEYKIGIMQMIPWLGKLMVQGNIQTLKAEAAFQKMQTVIDASLLKLRTIYYENYFLKRAVDITSQNIDLVKNWENVILSKYRTDMAGHSILIKTQIEAIKLEDDLKTLEARQDPLTESFRALLNLDYLPSILTPDSLSYQLLTYTRDEIEGIVLENNPGLKTLNLMHKASQKEVSRAKMNYLPDFSIGVDYIGTGEKFKEPGQQVPESGKDPLVIMGSVRIPLWFYKQSSGVSAARNQERKSHSVMEGKENSIKAEFESIWFELNDATRKVVLYRDILIPKSLECLRISEKDYISGTVDFLNLIDAQRRFLEFQLSFERSLVNYHKALARLEALAGRTL